ncbi:uncharacterized protein LOC142771733 [Rhipicephalus microplus]|uniref:uncharacterized protein LOC142771733 n=1 Tax=Rhipicephalus microplus TaxID=6941 RepID=UPI003F6C7075
MVSFDVDGCNGKCSRVHSPDSRAERQTLTKDGMRTTFTCASTGKSKLRSTGARLDVFLFARRQTTCFADPLSSRIEDRALCPFTRTVDLQAGRIPAAIPTVRCHCPGSRCSQINDFRCQEVREVLQVAYTENAGPTTFRNETFTVACACITSRTGRPVSDRLTRVDDHPSSPYGNRVRDFRWKYAVRQ